VISDEDKAKNMIMDTIHTLRDELCIKIDGLEKNSLQRVMKSWAMFPEPPNVNVYKKDEVEAINLAFKLIDTQVTASILAIGDNQMEQMEEQNEETKVD
jgi:hypothetical protein